MEFFGTSMVKIIIVVATSSDGQLLYIECVLFCSSVVRAKIHLHISLLMRVAKSLCVARVVVFDTFEKQV